MKVITLSEAKARLSKYAKLCKKEPIIVTVNGQAAFEIVALNEDDDVVDQVIAHNPNFQKLLAKRVKERSISAAAAAHRL